MSTQYVIKLRRIADSMEENQELMEAYNPTGLKELMGFIDELDDDLTSVIDSAVENQEESEGEEVEEEDDSPDEEETK